MFTEKQRSPKQDDKLMKNLNKMALYVVSGVKNFSEAHFIDTYISWNVHTHNKNSPFVGK